MTKNDIFFIGSAWDTGSGFIVKGYDFIITTVQAVGFAKNVVIKNVNTPKQIAKVIFTDYSTGLAFIEKPKNVNSSIDIIDFEMSVIEQLINIYSINYFNELLIVKSEITNNKFTQNGISHLLIDDKTDRLSGSLIFNSKNEFVGITKYLEKEEKNIVLPARYILKAMEEYASVGGNAVRCTSCYNVVSTEKLVGKTCPICSAEIMQELVAETLPYLSVTDQEIEAALKNLDFDLKNCRIGQHIWEITKDDVVVVVRYDADLKFIVAFSPVCELEDKDNSKIYEYLLKENNLLNEFSFSVNNNRIFLSSPYFIDDNFDEHFAEKILENLLIKAEFYGEKVIKM